MWAGGKFNGVINGGPICAILQFSTTPLLNCLKSSISPGNLVGPSISDILDN